MNRCPGCGYLLPSSWSSCRKCGSELGGAETAPAAVGASGAVGTHSATGAPAPAPPPTPAPAPALPLAPGLAAAPPSVAPPYPVVTPSTAPRVGARALLTPAVPKPVWTPVTEEQLRAVGTVPQTLLPNQHARRDPVSQTHDAPRDASPEATRDTMMPIATPAVVVRSQQPRITKRQRGSVIRVACFALALMVVGIVAGHFEPPAKGDAAVLPPLGHSLPSDVRANLRLAAAVDATRHYFLDHGTYEGVHVKDLSKREPGLNWKGAHRSAGSADVSVDVTDDATITLASRMSNGTCAFARDFPTEARTMVNTASGSECRAADAPEIGWGRVDNAL